MSDGNSNSDGNTPGLSAPEVMSHVGGPFEPTTDVLSDPFHLIDPFMSHSSALSGPEGAIQVNHHVIHNIPVTEPGQDYAGARDLGAQ